MKLMNICAVIALAGLFSHACFATWIPCEIYIGNDPVKIKESNECLAAQAKREAQHNKEMLLWLGSPR